MIGTRYHGYPLPDLDTSEIMRLVADECMHIVHMRDTFEPFLLDSQDGSCYALPGEVDGLISLIVGENRKLIQERLRNEQRV